MPLLGYYSLVKDRKIYGVFFPFLLMLLWGLIISVARQEWLSCARVFQIVGMVGFTHFLIRYYDKKELQKLLISILVLAVVYYLLEILFVDEFIRKKILFFMPWSMTVLSGLVGEPNYTGILMAGISIFFLAERKMFLFLVAMALLLVTGSRTSCCVFVMGLYLLIENHMPRKFSNFLVYAILGILISYPLIIYVLDQCASESLKKVLYFATTERFQIHATFIKMFLKNPLGIGVFAGRESFHSFCLEFSNVAEYAGTLRKYQYEQHSIFMQVLSEFGFPGYFFWSTFLIMFFKKALKVSFRHSWAFLCVLTGFLFLNGFAEFILYLFMAKILRESIDQKHVFLK